MTLDDGRAVGAIGWSWRRAGPAGSSDGARVPDTSIGDGLALAWDAGAALADLEFVQFHPTALDVPGRPARLLTEALRGEGATLVDAAGERFMARFHPLGELAPRDVVARALFRVREETGAPVHLDATGGSRRGVRGSRPRRSTAARRVSTWRPSPIPVAPAAHYFVGGVLTDVWGRTTVPGLLAAGEVAATGVHGANRLASNSLAEALVFGARAARAEEAFRRPHPAAPACRRRRPGAVPLTEIRDAADRVLGVRRSGPELEALLDRLRSMANLGRQRGRDARRLAWSPPPRSAGGRAAADTSAWTSRSRTTSCRSGRPSTRRVVDAPGADEVRGGRARGVNAQLGVVP